MLVHRVRGVVVYVLTNQTAWFGVMIALAMLLLLVTILTARGSTPYRA
jgi:hypothetical protein